MFKKNKYEIVKKTLRLQVFCSLLLAIAFLLFTKRINPFVSSLLGSGVVLCNTLVYGLIAFRRGLNVLPKDALRYHKNAITGRFFLNFILIALIFCLYKNCSFLYFFLSYVVVMACYWWILLIN